MKYLKNKVRAIIFDMDGTIIKTDHIWRKVTVDALSKNGVNNLSDDERAFIDSMAGMNMSKASEALKEEFGLEDKPQVIYDFMVSQANFYFGERLDFIQGFERFHKKLQKAGIPTGIATNAIPDNLYKIIKTMKFEDLFGKNIFSIEHVARPKPDPDLFLHAAAKLGAHPEKCVVFEDSIHGFKAAKAASIKCIAVRGPQNEDYLEHVDEHIDNYDQAEDALKKL